MSTERIRIWICQKKDRGVAAKYFFAASSLVFGLLTVVLTFWITYFVIYLAADGLSALCDLVIEKRFQVTPATRLILSGVFVLILFLQYFRTAPAYWKELPTDEKDFGPLVKATLGDYAVLSPVLSHPKTVAKSVADVLLTGPRLVLGTWRNLAEARRLKGLNEGACAQVLALVYSRPDAVPYEELCAAGWGRQLADLKTIDGVYFLDAGLLLSDELRTELSQLPAG